MEAEPDITGIDLLPVGSVPRTLAEGVARTVSRSVEVPCRVLPTDTELELPQLATRSQADADALLHLLEARARSDGSILVGLTMADIGSPVFTFFFGLARHEGHAALVSLARLTPAYYGLPENDAVTLERARREVLHEIGHVTGLHHCDDAACLMRFAGNVEALDVRGGLFCEDCRARLPGGLVPEPV